jgi:hypothetical protein
MLFTTTDPAGQGPSDPPPGGMRSVWIVDAGPTMMALATMDQGMIQEEPGQTPEILFEANEGSDFGGGMRLERAAVPTSLAIQESPEDEGERRTGGHAALEMALLELYLDRLMG